VTPPRLFGAQFGGLPPRRPDQRPPLSREGGQVGGAAGVFRGRLVIISGSSATGAAGLFGYSSAAPAANTLIFSDAPVNGRDSKGNYYLAGRCSYGFYSAGSIYVCVQLNLGVITWYTATTMVSVTNPWSAGPTMNGWTLGTGTLAVTNPVQLAAQLELAGLSAPAAVTGAASVYGSTTVGHVGLVAASGWTGTLSSAKTDTSINTVIGTTAANLTVAHGIPANDSLGGTFYRLVAYGNGTQGSTAQQLNIFGFVGGTQISQAGVSAGFAGASANFEWFAEWEIQIEITGASGTFNGRLAFTPSPNAATAQAPGTTIRVSSANSQATNSAYTIQLKADWASATGAPTITCLGSRLERIGP
jgi:hypothetical protein